MNVITEKLNEIYYLESNDITIVEIYNHDISMINQLLTESTEILTKIQDNTNHNLSVAKKYLSDNGIDVNRLKTGAKSIALSVKNDFKSRKNANVISKNLALKTSSLIKKEMSRVRSKIYSKDKSVSEKIFASIALLGALLLVALIVDILVSIFFGPTIGSLISALIAAPVLEEAAKQISITENYPWIYTSIFAGFEFIGYVVMLVLKGYRLGPVLIARGVGLILHFSTTYIQKYFAEKEQTKGPTSFSDYEKFDTIGYYIGVGVHFTFNLLALIFNEKLTLLIK